MQIIHIEAKTYLIPVELPRFPEPEMSECFVVFVHTDGGISGIGTTHRANRFACRETVKREISPFLTGRDPFTTERIWDDLFWRFNQRRMTGVWTAAMSAVDIALWDIKGKAFGLPIYRPLGDYSPDITAYCTFGMLEYTRNDLGELASSSPPQAGTSSRCASKTRKTSLRTPPGSGPCVKAPETRPRS